MIIILFLFIIYFSSQLFDYYCNFLLTSLFIIEIIANFKFSSTMHSVLKCWVPSKKKKKIGHVNE